MRWELPEERNPLTFGRSEGEPTQTAAKCWVPASIETKIGGFTIRGGLIYVGRNLRSVKQYMVEPALIDPSLETQPSTAGRSQ